ncbi:hypothetical protein BYT27DRAFT_7132765 [Phlegmacium glaucopus]|nr:hypothetical protein BYT27DRAFT_7132765 [Phlegmacium glaucopus]
MGLFNLFFTFIIFHLILIATSASDSTSTSITLSHKTSSHMSASTIHPPQIRPTRISSHSIQIITRPTFVSRTFPAVVPGEPVHTRPPDQPPGPLGNSNRRHARPGQKPIFIVFEVLGGLVASILLLGLLRCCYQYNKAPKRDRIAEVLNRHHLQRELEELERNPHILRRPSLREPAPPYFPAPPSYDIITSTPTTADVRYTDVDIRNLQSSQFPSPSRSPELIPPQPAG